MLDYRNFCEIPTSNLRNYPKYDACYSILRIIDMANPLLYILSPPHYIQQSSYAVDEILISLDINCDSYFMWVDWLSDPVGTRNVYTHTSLDQAIKYD
jgi:hypothetical protein